MTNYDKARINKHVSRLAKRGSLSGKKIVLFGASVFSKEIQKCLEENRFSADALIDNDSRKIGTRILGMITQKPEDELLPFNDRVTVLFYSPFYGEMTAQLRGMGYNQNRHFFVINQKMDDSLSFFAYLTFAKIKGWYWYRKITRGQPRGRTVFIAPYTGMGDIYLIGLLFNEYLRRNGITDYVFAVVNNISQKVAEMFDIKNITVLPNRAGDDIIIYSRVAGRTLGIVVLNDGWLGNPLQWLRGYEGLHFAEMFRRFVFGFNDNPVYELPPRKDYSKDIDKLFEKYTLIKGKTVVLSPYSNTLFDLPDEMLEQIVSYCKDHGYTVCTNCAGTEKPVEGTKAVFLPLNQAIAFMDAAGFFIGVRSGLCEVISSSICKKVIIYEKDGLFYKSSQIDYFSLKKMGLCDDVIELEYHDDLKKSCFREIINVFS